MTVAFGLVRREAQPGFLREGNVQHTRESFLALVPDIDRKLNIPAIEVWRRRFD